jgi:antitoxin MazE
MGKRLTKTGNSLALVLDREILEKTGITAETTLDISTDGDVIVVTPKRTKARAEKLRQVMTEADSRYSGVFRRLAK